MNKLFQNFAGIIPAGTSVHGSQNIQSDTPFLSMGLWTEVNSGGTPYMMCLVQGGKIISVKIEYVHIELTDEMKKALAEVVLTS